MISRNGNVFRGFADLATWIAKHLGHSSTTLHEAERLIESCKHCNPEGAEILFNNILDRVTGSDPSVTDYILETSAKCPNCRREILEKTLDGCVVEE